MRQFSLYPAEAAAGGAARSQRQVGLQGSFSSLQEGPYLSAAPWTWALWAECPRVRGVVEEEVTRHCREEVCKQLCSSSETHWVSRCSCEEFLEGSITNSEESHTARRCMPEYVFSETRQERCNREKWILRGFINTCFCTGCFPQSSLSLFNTRICRIRALFCPCSSPFSLLSSVELGGSMI